MYTVVQSTFVVSIKVHQNNKPARTVVSMICTSEYKLAKFLDSHFKSYLPNTHLLYSTEFSDIKFTGLVTL